MNSALNPQYTSRVDRQKHTETISGLKVLLKKKKPKTSEGSRAGSAIVSTSLTPQSSVLNIFTTKGFVTCLLCIISQVAVHKAYTGITRRLALWTDSDTKHARWCVQLVLTTRLIWPWAELKSCPQFLLLCLTKLVILPSTTAVHTNNNRCLLASS